MSDGWTCIECGEPNQPDWSACHCCDTEQAESERELETVFAGIITPGEVFDTRLYGRSVLADLRRSGYDIIKRG
jgi:hypothetical protein